MYLLDGNYYRALIDIDIIQHTSLMSNLPNSGDENTIWRSLPRGSYLLPKQLGTDFDCNKGDIFRYLEIDEYQDSVVYYRAGQNGKVTPDWKTDVGDLTMSECQWELVNDTANWMSLLRTEIGDKRLGDIIIPSTHDSGTSGITEDSILVDQNFLFQLAEDVTPATVVNWSMTQPDKFDLQMEYGFREFDMRIADVDEYEPGVFRWWHGLAGDDITEGLQHVAEFSADHPEEILLLSMGHFAAPGNASDPTLPIPDARKDVLSDLLLQYLGQYMTPKGNLSDNPSMNEVLATGCNIIMLMNDGYIRAKDDRYWSSIIHSRWTGVTNPEELFQQRTSLLVDFNQNYANSLTHISGCVTPNEQIVIAGLLNVYGDNETIRDIINDTLPLLLEVNTTDMSYEGLWVDLLNMARYGTNTVGMWARPMDIYTNGASVHYGGNNNMLRHWIARPDLYKPNIIGTDDFLSSTFVQTAISANSGDISREVTIAHQGNPMNGYYVWDHNYATSGGDAGLGCPGVDVQYSITDQSVPLDGGVIEQMGLLDIAEGQYPPSALCQIDVSSDNSGWIHLWTTNISYLFDNTLDVYIRGTDMGDASGFAYISTNYDDYGQNCTVPPVDGSSVLAYMEW